MPSVTNVIDPVPVSTTSTLLFPSSILSEVPAGKFVSADPSPANDVAVTIPVKNPSPSGLSVIPEPTRTSDLAVIIPTASILVTSS